METIKDDDKIKLVRKDKVIKIAQLAEKMRKCERIISDFSNDYLDFVKKHPFVLSLPNEWKNLDTVDLSASNLRTEDEKIQSVEKAHVRPLATLPNLNQRVTVFDYNNELFYETPAFQDFLNEADK